VKKRGKTPPVGTPADCKQPEEKKLKNGGGISKIKKPGREQRRRCGATGEVRKIISLRTKMKG